MSRSHLLRSKLRPRPQLRSIKVQGEDTSDASTSQACKKRDSTINTEVVEEWAREVDGACGESGAGEVVAGEEGGGVDLGFC